MNSKFVVALLLACGLMVVATAAQANGILSSLSQTSAVEMSHEQLAEIRGANHVIRLVQLRSGQTPPDAAAVDALTQAGSIGGVGQDRAVIVGLLP
jgi:hypothetical protein